MLNLQEDIDKLWKKKKENNAKETILNYYIILTFKI